MSKQRPYGNFEEAYLSILMNFYKNDLDALINKITSFDKKYIDAIIPSDFFYNKPHIKFFWLCLCYMYGEIDNTSSEHFIKTAYIPKENICICLDDIEYAIERIVI